MKNNHQNDFESIFENSPVAKILVDEQSVVQLVNRQAEILFGYSRKELVGETIDRLLPGDIRSRHPGLVQQYFLDPQPRQMGAGRTLYGLSKQGVRIPVEVGLNPVRFGESIRVLASVIDVSERLKLEARFEAAFEAAPNGMLMIDDSGTIVLLNRQIEEIFGYSRDELTGQKIELLVPDDVAPAHPQFVKSYLAAPQPRAMGTGRDLFGKHKSGELISVEIGLQPFTWEKETFVISSVVDITSRKKTEQEISDKTTELEQFAYRTSHDLKSPLLTIGGLLDCIVEDIDDGDLSSAVDNVLRVKGLTIKLKKLTEDILDLTKADLGNEKESKFDFEQFYINTKEKFSHLLQENSVGFSCAFAHDQDLVIQKTRLNQVLENLVSNGIKYCNKQLEVRDVKLQTFSERSRFFLRVEDNGIGIPADKHHEVFGMFKRFHQGITEGSGLGLYMIQKHVQKMGGEIKFKSSNKGTTFYLSFPLKNDLEPIAEKDR
jgi:PAS domain S-box-containing protein